MNVLIIGFSSIVQRRVLPALFSLPEVDRISIASRRPFPVDVIPPEKLGGIYQGYANALSKCEPCLAYVSLPNSMHAEWASHALDAGFHVIIDKPSVTNVADARELVEIAERKGLCLSEANVWQYYPLTQTIKNIVDKEKRAPLTLSATFSSPSLDPGNFRYNPDMGSGILLDRGSYAVSCGRFFFGEPPKEIICRVVSFDRKEQVDISFNVMMVYPGGSVLQGFFSLEAEYRNTLSIIGSSYYLDADRIFTPPADYNGVINVRRNNQIETIPAPAGDTFALFIGDVLKAIHDGSFARFSRILLEDAQLLHDMILSAKGE
jgi:dTDP-3,4-didehydro-2,6-dideoxy-alpha-D-glucose 3-reductase